MGDHEVRGEVAALTDAVPGPELASWLATLDKGALSAHDVVLVARAWERQKAYADARVTEALAELCGREEYQRCSCPIDSDVGHTHRAIDPAGDEVSLAMTWSPGRARNRIAVACDLVDELPATLTALDEGRIDADKARLIAERTRPRPPRNHHARRHRRTPHSAAAYHRY